MMKTLFAICIVLAMTAPALALDYDCSPLNAAPEILPNFLRPAERLGFAGREEGCRHLLENDGRYRQAVDQHSAWSSDGDG
jgi:hypothetical protein